MLTLTCTCGETFDRRVTPEEAKQPLPQIPIASRAAPAPPPSPPAASPGPAAPSIPRSRPAQGAARIQGAAHAHTAAKPRPRLSRRSRPLASRPAGERPRVTPSRELEDALRAALEAEAETVVRPAAPPDSGQDGAPRPISRRSYARRWPPKRRRQRSAAAGPARCAAGRHAGPGSRPRSAVTRLDLDLTIREALDRQRADAAEPREVDEPPLTRRGWSARGRRGGRRGGQRRVLVLHRVVRRGRRPGHAGRAERAPTALRAARRPRRRS